jgi:hypothetical protein
MAGGADWEGEEEGRAVVGWAAAVGWAAVVREEEGWAAVD